MLLTRSAPMGVSAFCIRAALGAYIHIIFIMPSQTMHTMSSSTVSGNGLEICLINPFWSPNWDDKIPVHDSCHIYEMVTDALSNLICIQHWLTVMVGNNTLKKASEKSFSCLHVWLMLSMTEGCSIGTKTISIISIILEFILFSDPLLVRKNLSCSLQFPCTPLLHFWVKSWNVPCWDWTDTTNSKLYSY